MSETLRVNRAQSVADQLRRGAIELLRQNHQPSVLAVQIPGNGCTHLLEISAQSLELGNVTCKTRYKATGEMIDRIIDLTRLPIADRELDALQTLASAIFSILPGPELLRRE